jgi:hypothetical protein
MWSGDLPDPNVLYGFRLIDSTSKGEFTRACEADKLKRHTSGIGHMATVCEHLNVEELEERYVGSHCFAGGGNNSLRQAMD